MSSLNHQETAALQEVDTQSLRLPGGKTAVVTTTWHTWLAYEELQAFYGWSEDEILTLLVEQCEAGDSDPSLAFEIVVEHAYAGCRHEDEQLHEADTGTLPLPLGRLPRHGQASRRQA
ncbi:hypothetical protein [Botrimarina hoheduenensis]|uniref:Uncharacterized protein n=1 Tax=Botrimarina hoheduenensis TaxID=2528000 RepID=A0A5C5WDB6_9BACT|nr:hypothetical protein [Botrimarina hoheduenensis]TWT48926.1 hypothetical protein Pla111_07040 [Botrimarina hoheduenensis]